MTVKQIHKHQGTLAPARGALPKCSPSPALAVIILRDHQLSANYLRKQCLIKLKPAGCQTITDEGNTAPRQRGTCLRATLFKTPAGIICQWPPIISFIRKPIWQLSEGWSCEYIETSSVARKPRKLVYPFPRALLQIIWWKLCIFVYSSSVCRLPA